MLTGFKIDLPIFIHDLMLEQFIAPYGYKLRVSSTEVAEHVVLVLDAENSGAHFATQIMLSGSSDSNKLQVMLRHARMEIAISVLKAKGIKYEQRS